MISDNKDFFPRVSHHVICGFGKQENCNKNRPTILRIFLVRSALVSPFVWSIVRIMTSNLSFSFILL